MGWFWDTKNNTDSPNNPYSKLDPSLREFLDEESPAKHPDRTPTQSTSSHSAPNSPSTNYRAQVGLSSSQTGDRVSNESVQAESRVVPSESGFQDGRYAHLWKTYKPQSEIEAAGKTDQDKLADIVDAYNDRRFAIGRAATENCIMEQMMQHDCWENGSIWDRMKLCRTQNKAFNRCYLMQSRLLKALGYLSTPRSEEEEERIQMHADKLYHDMLERERAADEARKTGLPEPEFPPLILPDTATKALGPNSAWARSRQKAVETGESPNFSALPPQQQAEIKKRMEKMNQRERELELQLIAAENRAQMEYAEQVKGVLETEKQVRRARRERGRETAGDTIKRLWGWDT